MFWPIGHTQTIHLQKYNQKKASFNITTAFFCIFLYQFHLTIDLTAQNM
jgi:hypothetical protein